MILDGRGQAWRRFRPSIGTRIVGLFIVLLLAVQAASFTALRASVAEHAQRVLPARLAEGERLVQNLLDRRAQTLIGGARLLAADYGFREAVSSHDADTIASVLANHGSRIGATEAALLGPDFRLIGRSGGQGEALPPLAAQLAVQAAVTGQGSSVALLGGKPYQAVLVPVKAPLMVGWVLMAFPLDERLADDFKSLSGLDLTLLALDGRDGAWRLAGSSLATARAQDLASAVARRPPPAQAMATLAVQGENLGVRLAPLLGTRDADGSAATGMLALVSLSLDEAASVPRDLQLALLAITVLGVAVLALGIVFIARRVAAPLRGLADAAERLGAGDYDTPMAGTQRSDEIGELSQSFERMRHSIAEHRAEVLRLAYRDPLTGLPNRMSFRDSVTQAIRQSGPGGSHAVVMLDLDRFKHVNDVLGYPVGDQLLVTVAQRLCSQLLRADDLVARLGGDEFGVLLRGADRALALQVARRLEQGFELPLAVLDHQLDMGAAIGIACWPADAQEPEALLNRAEVAMYAAKRRGGEPMVYEPSIDVASAQTLTLLGELRQAVESQQLRLALQPKLALADGCVVGAEALVRWQHPERGMVPPGQFIPFAEQTGFIRVLTRWVFEQAVRERQVLAAQGLEIDLSVNLSTRDLLDTELPQRFEALLAKHHAPARAFCLEITESAIMEDPQRAIVTLDRLAAIGFKLSIDDFGTGYSSLAYLKRLPVNELKIDQSFVRDMATSPDDAAIVRATIDLAHTIGIRVVAEGVENAEAWELLHSLGCDQAQGFHMGRPMPVADFLTWSRGWSVHRPRAVEARAPSVH